MDSSAIESLEYYEYRPALTERINDWGADFPIEAYNEDVVTQPSKSFIEFRGKVKVTQAGTATAAETTAGTTPARVAVTDIAGKVDLVLNGIMQGYDKIEYQMGHTKVDDILKPGVTMVMKGLPSYSRIDRFNDAGWCFDYTSASYLNKAGQFCITVPLSLIFGFADDYKGYIYRTPQRLIFTKSAAGNVNNLILCSDAKYTASIQFDEILWRMPQIKFNLVYDAEIKAEILKGVDYEIRFRHWLYSYKAGVSGVNEFTWDFPTSHARAKYVLVAFQKERANKPLVDSSKFDYCDLRSLQVQLNNLTYYPKERPSWNRKELKYSSLYSMYKDFQASYYSRDECHPLLNMNEFINSYPIVCIDCSRKPDVIKESLINVKLRFE